MRERHSTIAGMIAFLLISLGLALFQTSVWPFISPFSTQPSIWIFLVIYLALTRSFGTAVMTVYANTLLLHTLTGMSLTMLLAWQLLILVLISTIRKRIYLPTLSYFLVMCLIQIGVSFVALPVLSLMADPLPISTPPWRELLVGIALLPLFGSIVFKLGRFIDHVAPLPISEVIEQ